MKTNHIYLPELVGKGYKTFWKFTGRYRVCKGGRASKKSKTTALWFILHMSMAKYSGANLLVVRKVFRTLKDSCFTELKWAIDRLGLNNSWEVKESPLEMTFKPTGQKIYFRGLDDPMKITSITVNVGSLCWMWLEEAYEITRESDFNMLDESIRGQVQEGLFKQITLTLNPWNERHWIKSRFFDNSSSSDILAITTSYTCNEWLDKSDLQLFEEMKVHNPRRYKVAGLGQWGMSEGLVFNDWEERYFDIHSDGFRKEHPQIESAFGLDFGYTNDATALFCGLIDTETCEIFVFDELYEKGLTNRKVHDMIRDKGYSKERVIADSAEPKSIDELRELGIRNIRPARKGKDSVNSGIQYIQGFKLVIHPRCINFITEISSYVWDIDRDGKQLNRPIDDFNHLMDAMRYSMGDFMKGRAFSFE